jgi:type VI secretion system protein ImpA
MPSLDLSSLIQPIDPELPSGEDLEYDLAFVEMEQAAAGKPEMQMGNAVIEGVEPDWATAREHALELLTRTKDLRVCIYLCQASLRTHGFAGLAEALQLTEQINSAFWGSMHPQLDEDDDNDPAARVNALSALIAAPMLRQIELTPLLSVPVLGAVTWADVKPLSAGETPRMPPAEAQAIVNHSELSRVAEQRESLQAAIAACTALEKYITQQVGTSRAPNLQAIRDLLKRIEAQVGRWWTDRSASEAPADDVGTDASSLAEDREGEELEIDAPSFAESSESTSWDEDEEPVARGAGRASRHTGPIGSRQEVLAALDQILEYYRQYEPSSPLPLLLTRARRMANMSFLEILQDMIPEGLDRARAFAGGSGDLTSSSAGPAPQAYSLPPQLEYAPPQEESSSPPADDFF